MPAILLFVELSSQGRSEYLVPKMNWDKFKVLEGTLQEKMGQNGVKACHVIGLYEEYPLDAIIILKIIPAWYSEKAGRVGAEMGNWLRGRYCEGMMITVREPRGSIYEELPDTVIISAGLTKKGWETIRTNPQKILMEINECIEPLGGKTMDIIPVEGHYNLVVILETSIDNKDFVDRIQEAVSDEFCSAGGLFSRISLKKLPVLTDARALHVTVDFSFLKKYMEKGGLLMQALKCPHCGGSIDFPKTGNVTTCSYCGTSIYAQNVFEKLRSLEGL